MAETREASQDGNCTRPKLKNTIKSKGAPTRMVPRRLPRLGGAASGHMVGATEGDAMRLAAARPATVDRPAKQRPASAADNRAKRPVADDLAAEQRACRTANQKTGGAV